ncbi:hypothetical protein BD408DRAFT_175461 [Parasitella parasitica]|nr:hypothetical protein BD408DRAFT_175461 [Parasitella parasitica]
MEYMHSTSNGQGIDYSDYSNDSIINLTQESYPFVIAPSVPDHSSFSNVGAEQEGDLSFNSDGIADLFGSQTVDHSAPYASSLNLPSPISKHSSTNSLLIPDSQHASTSHAASPSTAAPASVNSQPPDMPNYDELSTVELKAKLKTYGFKTGNNRAQMIRDLKGIFMSIRSQSSSPQTSEPPLAISNQPGGLDLNKRKEIITHLRSNTDIWSKIVNYNVRIK